MEKLLRDPEDGSVIQSKFQSRKIALLRLWRPLPRLVKTFVMLLFISLIMTSLMLMRLLMGSPPDDGFDSLDYLKYSEKLAKENSVISASKVIHPMVNTNSGEQKIFTSQYYFPFKMMETKFDADEISWQRDILNRKQNFNAKQKAIIEAMSHSWKGYKYYAWGYDTLQPISKSGHNWFNVGLTIIDSLDTLLLMGMEKEFYDALEWIQKDLNFYQNNDVNCFEMTIRVLGGLLSAYHLTKSSDILFKAADIGDRLIHCYDSPSKVVPFSDVNLRSKLPHSPTWAPESSTSEVSTIQLEFRDLSRIIKQPIYETASFRTSEHIHNLTALDPLVPMYINPINGRFTISTITLGARSDSYYEYLFKQYLQTSKLWLREDFLRAMKAVKERLTQTTPKELKLQFIGEISPKDSMFIPKMDHLVCFMPGLLALANYHLSTEPNYRENESFRKQVDELMPWSQSLARTCYLMYNLTATGLAPEIAYFNLDKDDPSDEYLIRPRDTHNLLRPEYVESLFYLYQITKDEKYRTQGWEIFDAFNKYTRVPSGGYTSIGNVKDPRRVQPRDSQESFWTAETLKYLFLLFSDDEQLIHKILNNYVINSEGHLIRREYVSRLT